MKRILMSISAALCFFGCIDSDEIEKKIDQKVPSIIDGCQEICMELFVNEIPKFYDDFARDISNSMADEIYLKILDYVDQMGCLNQEQLLCIIGETLNIFNGETDSSEMDCI